MSSQGPRTLLRILAVVVVTALIAALAYLVLLKRSGMPWRGGERTLAGLGAEVVVRYDASGVPHIEGQTTEDALAVLGWVHANDRFTQMELGRRAAAGRLAEILGEPMLGADRHFRTLRFAATAEAMVETASPTSRRRLEAYARGVDAWLTARGNDLPPALRALGVEPEPWRPADSLAFVMMMANDLSFWQGRPEEDRFLWLRAWNPEAVRDLLGEPGLEIDPELLALAEELGPPTPPAVASLSGGPTSTAGDRASPGSNNWAVGPSRTAGGHALLANDPHLGLALPSVWYQVLVRSPDYTAAGMSLPGVPGVVLGRGEHIAWAFTNTMLDDHDLVFEQVDEAAGTYRRGERWLPLEVHEEIIPIRGGGEEKLTLRATDLGPLLEADEAQGLPPRSLVWTLHRPGDPLAALAAAAQASRPEELLEGIAPYVGPAQNFVAAFDDGSLLFTVLGAIPDRWDSPSEAPASDGDSVDGVPVDGKVTQPAKSPAAGENSSDTVQVTEHRPMGRLPVVGWHGDAGWRGLRAHVDRPKILAPAGDRLVTANHDIRPADYALPLLAEFFPGHRARRIVQRIDEDEGWTPEGFSDLQNDVVSLFAHDLIAALAPDAQALEGDARRAWEALEAWDGAMTVQGTGALFALVERNLLGVFFADEAETHGLDAFANRAHLLRLLGSAGGGGPTMAPHWFDDVSTPEVESRLDGVSHALAEAWREGQQRWGDDPSQWSYGELHSLTLRHLLDPLPLFGPWARRGPLAMPGSNTTVAAFGAVWEGENQQITYGPSMRWVVDWSQPDQAWAALPGGQSGHPADVHYDDRLAPYLAGELGEAPWTPEAIERATVSIVRLQP